MKGRVPGRAGLGGTGHGGEPNCYPQRGFAGTDGTGASGGGGGHGGTPSAGGAGGSGVVIVRFIPPTDGTLPLAGPIAVRDATATTAVLDWRLVADAGSGVCIVSAEYGYDPDNCSRSLKLADDAAIGSATSTLAGLAPGRTYYLKLTAENAAGKGESALVSFSTLPESVSTQQNPYAGLMQAHHYYDELQYDWNEGAWNYNPDPFGEDGCRVPGVVMTNTRQQYIDEDGHRFYLPDYAIFTYGGYVYLESGRTYTLGKYFGERVNMTVDGREVFSDANGNAFASGSFSVDETGWHPVRFLVYKAYWYYGPTGAAAATDHWNSSLGFAYRTDGSTAELPQSSWTPFVDSGDGSFLCTKTGFRTCAVDSWTMNGSTLSANLVYSPGARAFALKAFAGEAYGGEDIDGWETVVPLGEVTSGTTQGTAEVALAAGVNYVRFALVDATGAILPGWSATISLADAVDAGERAGTGHHRDASVRPFRRRGRDWTRVFRVCARAVRLRGNGTPSRHNLPVPFPCGERKRRKGEHSLGGVHYAGRLCARRDRFRKPEPARGRDIGFPCDARSGRDDGEADDWPGRRAS